MVLQTDLDKVRERKDQPGDISERLLLEETYEGAMETHSWNLYKVDHYTRCLEERKHLVGHPH